jgi:hypothetical protein
VWNGPVGVFEFPAFENGTRTLAHAIAESSAFSVAGGGDTLAAIAKYGIEKQVGYISTGGGAFLEVLEGKTLPAFEILTRRAEQSQAAGVPAPLAASDFDAQRGLSMMGSAGTLRKILHTVVDSLSTNLPAIDAALTKNDMVTVNGLLHGMKGYVPIFCSDALIAQVVDAERTSKTGSAAEVAPLYAQLAPKLEALLIEIKGYIAQGTI